MATRNGIKILTRGIIERTFSPFRANAIDVTPKNIHQRPFRELLAVSISILPPDDRADVVSGEFSRSLNVKLETIFVTADQRQC